MVTVVAPHTVSNDEANPVPRTYAGACDTFKCEAMYVFYKGHETQRNLTYSIGTSGTAAVPSTSSSASSKHNPTCYSTVFNWNRVDKPFLYSPKHVMESAANIFCRAMRNLDETHQNPEQFIKPITEPNEQKVILTGARINCQETPDLEESCNKAMDKIINECKQ
jgi:hypothetical protein